MVHCSFLVCVKELLVISCFFLVFSKLQVKQLSFLPGLNQVLFMSTASKSTVSVLPQRFLWIDMDISLYLFNPYISHSRLGDTLIEKWMCFFQKVNFHGDHRLKRVDFTLGVSDALFWSQTPNIGVDLDLGNYPSEHLCQGKPVCKRLQ